MKPATTPNSLLIKARLTLQHKINYRNYHNISYLGIEIIDKKHL
jgi:hypothetical protein